jgi:exosortase H (IPTLxxWG-CTERM-specific)
MDRIRAIWENPAYRFVLLFALLLGALTGGYLLVTERWFVVIQTVTRWTAWLEWKICDMVGATVTLEGNLVYLDGFAVRIIEECTGAFEVIIFSAAVLAFPTTWPRKLIGLGLGIPILYGFNVIRILVLLVVGRYQPSIFEFMHLYFWQATLILMITSVWLLWIFKVVRHEAPSAAALP